MLDSNDVVQVTDRSDFGVFPIFTGEEDNEPMRVSFEKYLHFCATSASLARKLAQGRPSQSDWMPAPVRFEWKE